MLKVSEIISTPVISLYEGECEGYIHNILFNTKSKKCTFFCISDNNDNIKKVINIKNIHSISKECAFVKNSSCLELENNFDSKLSENVPIINLNTYNLNGKYLGRSIDVAINSKNDIEAIYLNNNIKLSNQDIFIHVL